MKVRTKAQMAADLDRILLVRGISWEKLPQKDLVKLLQAFQKLKHDVEVFSLLEDIPTALSAGDLEKSMKKRVSYVI